MPIIQSRTWSTAALAALAAELAPRASMMAAPRFCTVGMKSSTSQLWSVTTSEAARSPISAWVMSGYWVAEWLPHTTSLVMSVTATPAFLASWPLARLWSSRIIAVNRSAGTPCALVRAISALVFAGLPGTSTRRSSAACSARALPCTVKIAPLASSRSPRSIPFVRGRAPTSRAMLTPSKTVPASSPVMTSVSSGNAQSSSSITTPSSAFIAGVISSRCSWIGVSGPNISPLAMRNSKL